MDAPPPPDSKGSVTLLLLTISLLACVVIPAAFSVLSTLLCARKGAAADPLAGSDVPEFKKERRARQLRFGGLVAVVVLGSAALVALAAQLSALTRRTSPFEVLGLPDGADTRAIRSAYRKLSLTAHPDKGGDKARFQRIVKAYETLTDPEQRAAWEAGAADDEGGRDRDGTTGFEEVSLKDSSGKAVLLAYVSILFIGLPLGILAFRNSGKGGAGALGGEDALAEAAEIGEEALEVAQRREEAKWERREREAEEKRARREEAAAAAAAAKAAGAAARLEGKLAARAAAAAREAEIQARRAAAERERLGAERDAEAALAAAAQEDPAALAMDADESAALGSAGRKAPSPSASMPWTAGETAALAAALAQFPAGTRGRWGVVAARVGSAGHGRTPDECIARAKEAAARAAADAARRRLAAAAEAAAEAAAAKRAAAAAAGGGAGEDDGSDGGGSSGSGSGDDEGDEEGGADAAAGGGDASSPAAPSAGAGAAGGGDGDDDVWTPRQQSQLEAAMRRFPSSQEGRWAAIAAKVGGKTQKQCVARFKALRVQLLAAQAAAAAAGGEAPPAATTAE
jgi:curved DNA-binding protein CbpA